MTTATSRAARLITSVIDPRAYFHLFKLINFYNYAHVEPLRSIDRGQHVRIAPNVSFRNAANITIGDRTHIGERCSLWAGETQGNIVIGRDCLLAPEVSLMSANYRFSASTTTRNSGMLEEPIFIGDNVWLGTRVVITAGVHIGSNTVIGAGAVVTNNIPANCVAVGVPAQVVRKIEESVQ